jgi:phenylpropionate dioxygenase-like ring-hydroxylating dioxygenase large terminal subunit
MNRNVLRYFHPILPSENLRRQPVQVEIAGRAYVLFRDADRHPAALDGRCPHRRASLSKGRVHPNGRLVCPYHGWSFDAEGRGRSPACPTLSHCDTRAYQVVERFGFLWLAERETSPAAFPTLGWPDFNFAGSVSTLVRAPMEVTLDNISEDEHFPYIHTTFGWGKESLAQVRVVTATFDDYSEVRYTGPQRASVWAPLGGVRTGDQFHNEWYTRFEPVHTVFTFGWHDRASGVERPVTTRAAVFLVPETDMSTRIHMFLFLKIAPSLHRHLRRLMHWLARHIASLELARDVRLIEDVAAAPASLSGMRLTQFDKALIHNRKLLQTVYWATAERYSERPIKEAISMMNEVAG